ncbi:MAG: cyclic nucleotide-binding domain-containing protein [Alphaproteobacteria bacterium]|nr:cyclic nucleotide-binding domain-containing protein [Alphaproteobacteria bacterium]
MASEKSDRVVCKAGQRIFHEGEAGDRAYLVVSGQLEVSKSMDGGETTVLALIGRGEIVGEMALINNAPRTATVRATTDSELLIVSPESFQRKLSAMEPVTQHLIKKFVNIIRDQNIELSRLRKVVR